MNAGRRLSDFCSCIGIQGGEVSVSESDLDCVGPVEFVIWQDTAFSATGACLSFCFMWDSEDVQICKRTAHWPWNAPEMFPWPFYCPGKRNVQPGQTRQVRDFGRLVACVVRRVKMKGKAPFSASRHVVSDLRYREINLPGKWSLVGEAFCSTKLPGLRGTEPRLWC